MEITKDDKIILEIYQELFKKSKPKGNFKEMMKSGETKKKEFFMNYYLDDDKQEEIIEKVLDKYKIKEQRRRAFRTEIFLGCSPTGVKK